MLTKKKAVGFDSMTEQPPHAAKKTQEFHVQETPDFMRKSPDINPCYYSVWSFLKAAVSQRRDKIITLENLKKRSLWKSGKSLTPKSSKALLLRGCRGQRTA